MTYPPYDIAIGIDDASSQPQLSLAVRIARMDILVDARIILGPQCSPNQPPVRTMCLTRLSIDYLKDSAIVPDRPTHHVNQNIGTWR